MQRARHRILVDRDAGSEVATGDHRAVGVALEGSGDRDPTGLDPAEHPHVGSHRPDRLGVVEHDYEVVLEGSHHRIVDPMPKIAGRHPRPARPTKHRLHRRPIEYEIASCRVRT